MFVRVAWTADIYSQTSLIRTPKGQNQLSALQRCPYYRGRECMIFGISGIKRTERCPYYRGVCKERSDCIFTRLVFGESETGLHNFGEFSQSPSSVNWFCVYFMVFLWICISPFPRNTRKTIFYWHWLKEEFLLMVKFCKSHTCNQFLFHQQKRCHQNTTSNNLVTVCKGSLSLKSRRNGKNNESL